MLLCKGKIQYLLTLLVSRYCILALHSSMVKFGITVPGYQCNSFSVRIRNPRNFDCHRQKSNGTDTSPGGDVRGLSNFMTCTMVHAEIVTME